MRDQPSQDERRGAARVLCPGCSHPLRLVPSLSGRRIRCLGCRSILVVEASGADPASWKCTLVGDADGRLQLCPECGARFRLVPRLHGRRVRCKGCQTVLRVSAKPWSLSPVLLKKAKPDEVATASEPAKRRNANVAHDRPAVRLFSAEGSGGRPAGHGSNDQAAAAPPSDAARGVLEPNVASIEHDGEEVKNADPGEGQPDDKPAISDPPAPRPLWTLAKSEKRIPSRGLTGRGATVAAAAIAVVLLGLSTVGALAVGAWWLLFPVSVPPQARYLPDDCDRFTSIDWQRCVAGGMLNAPKEMPEAGLMERCRMFLANAELPNEAVERINAGRAADGTGMVVAYFLNRPVQPEEVFEKRAFRGSGKRSYAPERIGGVTVYVYQTVAVAFPEPQVVLTGDLFAIRKILTRWSKTVRESMKPLLDSVEFSAPAVSLSAVAPRTLLNTHLQDCKHLESAITGTIDLLEFGETMRIVRLVRVADPSAAETIRRSLKRSLTAAAAKPRVPESVRKVLTSVEVAEADGGVKLTVTLRRGELTSPVLSSLSGLF